MKSFPRYERPTYARNRRRGDSIECDPLLILLIIRINTIEITKLRYLSLFLTIERAFLRLFLPYRSARTPEGMGNSH